ncbi:uncharacterized protein CAALFM_C300120WA [Candida albicans SC5314]|uniref:Uncharacterized protein n=1 Tax=Candida albicans (strain SC5314 / ATCC MYA-2876) TaxID=237561 RepID=Q5A7K2_CANAL|nr:uncharacterized protein CAALFM_C300120WA [Candida albicans SC5314]AOW28062.1 hypothetical protein CAALFM_C300120WA [Candida albicans SC5314]|eukprot:XP_717835.1 hypothetical protein CAALFM_C300120WA [Candida albicans SC5314]
MQDIFIANSNIRRNKIIQKNNKQQSVDRVHTVSSHLSHILANRLYHKLSKRRLARLRVSIFIPLFRKQLAQRRRQIVHDYVGDCTQYLRNQRVRTLRRNIKRLTNPCMVVGVHLLFVCRGKFVVHYIITNVQRVRQRRQVLNQPLPQELASLFWRQTVNVNHRRLLPEQPFRLTLLNQVPFIVKHRHVPVHLVFNHFPKIGNTLDIAF